MSTSERTSVSLTGRKQRRKGDGGEWVEDELEGGCRRGEERRYPAADCWYHGSSTECSVALQLEVGEKLRCMQSLVCL